MFCKTLKSCLFISLVISPLATMAQVKQNLIVAKISGFDNSQIYSPDATQQNIQHWDELSNEFLTLYSHGEYKKAKTIALQSLDYSKRIFGFLHQNTADALNKLGIASEATGNLDIAKAYYEDSLRLFQNSLGMENAKVAMVLNNLGNIYYEEQGYTQSENFFLKSLLMRQNLFSSIHPTVARSAYNLAKLYEIQGKYSDAILFYKQAAVLWKKTLGPSHLHVANTYNNLANVYANMGNDTASEELHLKALTIREYNLGVDDIVVAESLFNLGTICTKQEKYDEAETFYQEALTIMEKILNDDDPQIAMTLYSLANIYHIQAQQEFIYNQELNNRIDNTELSVESEQSEINKNNIMITQLNFRRKYVKEIFSRAEPLYKRAINIVESSYGSEHPSVKIMKDELKMLYSNIENSLKTSMQTSSN